MNQQSNLDEEVKLERVCTGLFITFVALLILNFMF
jgi:hypothetical protein